MFDHYNFTYCIRCDNLDLIEQALTRIFEQEGCRRTLLPALPIDIEQLRCKPWQMQCKLWTIGLFVGAPGWTIVKALPEEILCLRAKDDNRPPLSELAMQTGSDAFYLGVYNCHKLLMEVDTHGSIFISGDDDSFRFEEGKFFDEQINTKETERFFLLEMPVEQIQRIETEILQKQEKSYEQWEEQFLKDYARDHLPDMTFSELEQWMARWKGKVMLKPENWQQLSRQEEWQQLFAEWAAKIQDWDISQSDAPLFEQTLERLLGGTSSYWHLGREPLIYRAYTQQQQLADHGARLLHFQPAEQLRQTMDEIIRGKRSNRVQTDEDDIPW